MGSDSTRAVWAIAAVCLVIGGSIGYVFGSQSAPKAIPLEPRRDPAHAAAEPKLKAKEITVQVSGAVQAPGIYVLRDDQRVLDAVQAAGGTTADAQALEVNLAAMLKDGMSIEIPFQTGQSASQTPQEPSVIALNSATAQELESLPGIGPVIAERIVNFREFTNGFNSVEELTQIQGITPRLLDQIRPYIRL